MRRQRDNPKGYHEWEPIKQIGWKPELLDQEGLDGFRCTGKNLACSPKGTALAIPATKSDWRFPSRRWNYACKETSLPS
jgi:hypothetical protein